MCSASTAIASMLIVLVVVATRVLVRCLTAEYTACMCAYTVSLALDNRNVAQIVLLPA